MASERPLSFSSKPLSASSSLRIKRTEVPGVEPSPRDGPLSGSSMTRPPLSALAAFGGSNPNLSTARRTGSPSFESGAGRPFPRRTRDLQLAEGGMPSSLWPGPPTSGNSTPLPQVIPESPTDTFPDLVAEDGHPLTTGSSPNRSRAGTMPSRFGTNTSAIGQPAFGSKFGRPSPTHSPFKPIPSAIGTGREAAKSNAGTASAMETINRLRSGSLRASANSSGPTSPFGSSIFAPPTSSTWMGRNRASTLQNVSNAPGPSDPSSPTQSGFSREGLGEGDVKTLDYLGLAETPKLNQASLVQGQGLLAVQPVVSQRPPASYSAMHALNNNNRLRSYSVNATEKYAAEEDSYDDADYSNQYSAIPSGNMTPAQHLAELQRAIDTHNMQVQAFATQAANRPRAKTSSIAHNVDADSFRNYLVSPSRINETYIPADLRVPGAREPELQGLTEALRVLQFNNFSPQGVYPPPPAAMDHGHGTATRSIWLGNVPASTTNTHLSSVFAAFGVVESVRILTQKGCGFVNFMSVEEAIRARQAMNGRELFPGQGAVKIGFAKAPSSGTSGRTPDYGLISPADPEINRSEPRFGHQVNGQQSSTDSVPKSPLAVPALEEVADQILSMVSEFGATEEEHKSVSNLIEHALMNGTYQPEILNVEEPSHNRIYDAPKLRDIRKRIDNGVMTLPEVEEIARSMLDEVSELSSDYIGNTVVQKLFENCTNDTRELMLHEIAPDLAKIGVHKNGTWAAQKIIEVAGTPTQMQMIVDALRPYTVALFADQFGNYVIQGCLRFGAPYNDFIFEAMLGQLWPIANNRFGARAMRACLESHSSSKGQQRLLASAIALNGVQLASNLNATLLLTWYLDTWTHPRRRQILTSAMKPHLIRLCTDKVAYLTVLKVINQKAEPLARETLLNELFFSPNNTVLEQVLRDESCGPTLVFKVLTTPFIDENLRNQVYPVVKTTLQSIGAGPTSAYKRLMDEIGMSTRAGSQHRDGYGSASRHRSQSRDPNRVTSPYGYGGMPHPPLDRTLSGQYLPSASSRTQYLPSGANMGGLGSLNGMMHNGQENPNAQYRNLQHQSAMLAQAAQGLARYSQPPSASDQQPRPEYTAQRQHGNSDGQAYDSAAQIPRQQFSPLSPYHGNTAANRQGQGLGAVGFGKPQQQPPIGAGMNGATGGYQPGPGMGNLHRGRMPMTGRTHSNQYL